jgi:glycosyltransferase involved in cell wall biosynthesis
VRICVVTRSYPSPGNLYQYPFVHRRVLAYGAAGHDVSVFRPGEGDTASAHDFEGVTCLTGNASALRRFAASWKPEVIAAHGLSEAMWEVLRPVAGEIPVRAWLHGSEIPEFMRRKALVTAAPERASALEAVKVRCDFWNGLLGSLPPGLKLVFVSEVSVDMARVDWGSRLANDDYAIVPNPIDTGLFQYRPKAPGDRLRVLLIRPFDSQTYANDLAVEAVARLASARPELRFTIIGDGPLFESTLAPLRGLAAVEMQRRFLAQEEIAEQHRRHGIFLVPTRLDTQGVSRDEAMASGLVPVTNAIPAVREFVDEGCAAIAPPDDSAALAESIVEMIGRPQLFLERSRAAADRIRRERSNTVIIPRELALLEEAAHG